MIWVQLVIRKLINQVISDLLYVLLSYISYLYILLHIAVDEDVFLLSNFPFFPILPGFTASGLSGRPAAVLNDILFEGQEQFFIEIVAVSGGVIGPLSTATVIIEDSNGKTYYRMI